MQVYLLLFFLKKKQQQKKPKQNKKKKKKKKKKNTWKLRSRGIGEKAEQNSARNNAKCGKSFQL